MASRLLSSSWLIQRRRTWRTTTGARLPNPTTSQLVMGYEGVCCRAGFDLMLFLSRFEAWGMPVLEAMASGVPVVTSRCYGVEHFASHGVNCLMVPSRDVQVMLLFYSLLAFLCSPFFTQSCCSALIPCLICLHGITFLAMSCEGGGKCGHYPAPRWCHASIPCIPWSSNCFDLQYAKLGRQSRGNSHMHC